MTEFKEFYDLYPRKKKPRYARECYDRALKRATHEDIMSGLTAMVAAGWDDIQFVPYPSSWLNGDCWLEESDPEPEVHEINDRQKLVTFISKGRWNDRWPNKPESVEEAKARLEKMGNFQYEQRLRIVK